MVPVPGLLGGALKRGGSAAAERPWHDAVPQSIVRQGETPRRPGGTAQRSQAETWVVRSLASWEAVWLGTGMSESAVHRPRLVEKIP